MPAYIVSRFFLSKSMGTGKFSGDFYYFFIISNHCVDFLLFFRSNFYKLKFNSISLLIDKF
ncbi:hypothetical protein BZG02_17405 [Labilibaculum filiforme]|uniref:Uncharacterized protein n=1 Tax=Labilibaculum filiforme TaxID=1940526 RepID=A0A2N3HS91_9BACT|nr:hypothetical protein BZG02_17405 [Labilibaculum filiforme]